MKPARNGKRYIFQEYRNDEGLVIIVTRSSRNRLWEPHFDESMQQNACTVRTSHTYPHETRLYSGRVSNVPP